jgi:hypothetical protein
MPQVPPRHSIGAVTEPSPAIAAENKRSRGHIARVRAPAKHVLPSRDRKPQKSDQIGFIDLIENQQNQTKISTKFELMKNLN